MARNDAGFPVLPNVAETGLDPARVAASVDRAVANQPRLGNLWDYYRNPMKAAGALRTNRPYKLAQERGLPLRLTNPAALGANTDDRGSKREIVIENDIAWRVHVMIDFLFGRPFRLVSAAQDEQLAATIGTTLERVWEASGGLGMLQNAALIAHVHGSVDFLVRPMIEEGEHADAARAVRIEPVDPSRGAPVLSNAEAGLLDGYVVHASRPSGRYVEGREVVETVADVYAPTLAQKWIGDEEGSWRLVSQARNRVSVGEVPVVHVQNAAQPFAYEGLGEVEPLIPLQDELNTRLSDRANRVTMQSFKMYLAKGVDGFEKTAITPGLLISTENPDAAITAFGGDAASPSEDRHIDEIREAMDKLSGVPPLATGVVRAKIGNLTSENALRLTLQGLLARTARKRITYGRGIAEVSRLVLSALNEMGVLKTNEADRLVRIEWPDPLSGDTGEAVRHAQGKIDLGVSRERVLGELGYAAAYAGVE